MVVWWLSEALPAPATALVPVIAFPLLGVMEMRAAAAPYAHPLIFLFLGGFLIAGAVERSGLHRRVALGILGRAGAAPARLAASFMLAAALLSMWLSNSATAILMLPIALSVIGLLDRGDRRFAAALLLGVAYAAQHRRAGHADRHAAQRPAAGLSGGAPRRRDRLRAAGCCSRRRSPRCCWPRPGCC